MAQSRQPHTPPHGQSRAWHQSSGASEAEQWNALRDELEDLLDELTAHTGDDAPRRPARTGDYPAGLHAPHNPRDRKSAALQSVQDAVERFSEFEEDAPMPTSTRQGLQDAIEQIRSSRQHQRRRGGEHLPDYDYSTFDRRTADRGALTDKQWSYRRNRPEAAPSDSQLAALSISVNDISRRLQRFDDMLSSNSLSGAHLGEIAVQIEQLTSIVEVLAGKVNQRGAFETIEQQLVELAQTVDRAQGPDLTSIEQRLEGLGQAMELLGRAQSSSRPTFGQDEADRKFGAIEDGVRGIYDRLDQINDATQSGDLTEGVRALISRIDALEQLNGAPSEALTRLTEDVASLHEAFKANRGSNVSAFVGSRIDALNDRIAGLESAVKSSKPAALELNAVRETMSSVLSQHLPGTERDDALAARLAEIDTKIGGIANGLKTRSVRLETSPKLEEQIKTLTAKLEETSADLDSLRTARDQQPAVQLPDMSELADLIAERTGAELAKSSSRTSELLARLEDRLDGLMAAAPKVDAATDLSGVENGLKSINARLAELERGLSTPAGERASTSFAQSLMDKTAVDAAHANPAADARQPTSSPKHPGLTDGADGMSMSMSRSGLSASPKLSPDAPVAKAATGSNRDAMPRSPVDDAPLNAPAFPAPSVDSKASGGSGLPDSLREKMARLTAAAGLSEMEPPLIKAHSGAQPQDLDELPPAPTSDFASPQSPQDDNFSFGTEPEIASEDMDATARAEAPIFGRTRQSDQFALRTAQNSARGHELADDQKLSRSTFIAAARRAAQANNPQHVDDAGSNSLIGRALSRIQRKRAMAEEIPEIDQVMDDTIADPIVDAPELVEDVVEEPKPRLGRFHLRRKQEQKAKDEPVADDAVLEVEEEDHIAHDEEFDLDGPRESFLTRHSRPILLGLTVLAASLLTLNLVSQRLGAETPEAVVEAASPTSEATDPSAVGSISFDKIEDGLTSSDDAVRLIDPALSNPMPPRLETASLNFQPTAGFGQPTLPDAIGPEALRDAALGGDARAQFEVASILAEGGSAGQNMADAAKWYEQSALQGFGPATYLLANMYENGTGIAQDLDQAVYWYQRGADVGNRMSMHNLAAMYASGGMGAQDFTQAAFWFERAAALGLTDSQFNLGMLHARGLGVPQDLEQSYFWFSIAADGGDADAARARDDVARSLSADVVARLVGEISAWSPQQLDISANFAPIGTWSDSFDPGQTIDNRDVVQKVQAALNRLGYDAGTADGLMGPKTADAISAFESATGMSTTGLVNPRLLAVLGSQPA